MIKILNSLCYSVIVINRNKQILFINKFLLELLGVNDEDVIGKNLFQIISITNHSFDKLINELPQNNKSLLAKSANPYPPIPSGRKQRPRDVHLTKVKPPSS